MRSANQDGFMTRRRGRLVPLVVAAVLSLLFLIVRRDYWGFAFGLSWVAFIFLYPVDTNDKGPGLRKMRMAFAACFLLLCAAAIWATVVHAY
jgi:hypothetical protein